MNKLYKFAFAKRVMKKAAKDIKKGDKVILAGAKYLVKEIEISDIGKLETIPRASA